MQTGIKIYKIHDFIRKNESGNLSYNRIRKIIIEIATAASMHRDHNILIDFRKTSHWDVSMIDILKAATELENFKDVLTTRIANVVPKDKDRIVLAKTAETAFQLKGFQYKFFTDFEEAIEWLSDVSG